MPEQPQPNHRPLPHPAPSSSGPDRKPFHLRILLANGEKATVFVQDILSVIPDEILSRHLPAHSQPPPPDGFKDRLTIIESQLAWLSKCITFEEPEEEESQTEPNRVDPHPQPDITTRTTRITPETQPPQPPSSPANPVPIGAGNLSPY